MFLDGTIYKDYPKANIPKEEQPKAKIPKSSPSSSNFELNAYLGDDWGSLDFSEFFIGEYKVNLVHLQLLIILNTSIKEIDHTLIEKESYDPI